MALRTGAARAWAGLADIENEDIKVRYAGKKGPKRSRQKAVKDGGFVIDKEIEFQEENGRAKAAMAKAKAQNDSVEVG